MPWLLEAEDVGIGGENGSDDGKCVIDACRLMVEPGETDGGGGSSFPKETPSALSLASCSSSTYLFQAIEAKLARTQHECLAAQTHRSDLAG